jgi:hypothetical protein
MKKAFVAILRAGFMKKALVAIAILLLVALWTFHVFEDDSRAGAKSALTATTPARGSNDIRIDGWVDDSRVQHGDQVAFWINVQNTSGQPIQNVSVISFRMPGFEIPANAACWDKVRRVPCFARPKLLAGDVATLEGQLRAGSTSGKYALSAVIVWTDSANVRRRKPISIGPITIENAAQRYVFLSLKAAQTFVKDLALPLALAWLAFYLKKIEDGREEARKNIAEARAAQEEALEDSRNDARRLAAERAAQLQQTWNLMLPKAHDNAVNYYMPVAADAQNAEGYHGKEARFAVFFYLRFLSQMKAMTDAISGFYFKNRDGEEVASQLWEALKVSADSVLSRPRREWVQDTVLPKMTFRTFDERLAGRKMISETEQIIDANHEWFAKQMPLLRLFRLILQYEMNCAYEFWYEKAEDFPTTAYREALSKVKSNGSPSGFDETEFLSLIQELNRYGTRRSSSASETAHV